MCGIGWDGMREDRMEWDGMGWDGELMGEESYWFCRGVSFGQWKVCPHMFTSLELL